MNPVDYLSRDTLKRALGQRLVPAIEKWTSSYGTSTTRRQYTIEIEGRRYLIKPFLITERTRSSYFNKHGGYRITVTRGDVTRYIDNDGWENSTEHRAGSVYAVDTALKAVNKHLYRYPS